MNKTPEGMARAYCGTANGDWDNKYCSAQMRDVLLWLADNVSDEMVYAYLFDPVVNGRNVDENVRKSISAALRAAASEGEAT